MPDSDDELPEGRAVHRRTGSASSGSRSRRRSLSPRPSATIMLPPEAGDGVHGRLRHRSSGPGSGASTRTGRCSRSSSATRSAARPTASAATRSTTSCTTTSWRRRPPRRARPSSTEMQQMSSTTRRRTTSCTTTRTSTPTGPTSSPAGRTSPRERDAVLHLRHAQLHAADGRDVAPTPAPVGRHRARRARRRPSRRRRPARATTPGAGSDAGSTAPLLAGLAAVVAVRGRRSRLVQPATERCRGRGRGRVIGSARFGGPPTQPATDSRPPGMSGRYLARKARPGDRHDPRDRRPQLRPVPDDARLARSGCCSRNPNLTQEMIAEARARWGLDKPLIPDQLVGYIARDRLRATSATRSSTAARRSPRSSVSGSGRRSSCSASARSSRSSSAFGSAPSRAGNAAARSTASATG